MAVIARCRLCTDSMCALQTGQTCDVGASTIDRRGQVRYSREELLVSVLNIKHQMQQMSICFAPRLQAQNLGLALG